MACIAFGNLATSTLPWAQRYGSFHVAGSSASTAYAKHVHGSLYFGCSRPPGKLKRSSGPAPVRGGGSPASAVPVVSRRRRQMPRTLNHHSSSGAALDSRDAKTRGEQPPLAM